MRICVLFDCRLRCLRRPRLFIGVSAVTNFTFETLLANWKETGKGTSYGRDSDSDGNNVLQKIAILSRQTSRLYFILCLDSFPLPLRDRQITLIMCTKISRRMSGSRKRRRNDPGMTNLGNYTQSMCRSGGRFMNVEELKFFLDRCYIFVAQHICIKTRKPRRSETKNTTRLTTVIDDFPPIVLQVVECVHRLALPRGVTHVIRYPLFRIFVQLLDQGLVFGVLKPPPVKQLPPGLLAILTLLLPKNAVSLCLICFLLWSASCKDDVELTTALGSSVLELKKLLVRGR